MVESWAEICLSAFAPRPSLQQPPQRPPSRQDTELARWTHRPARVILRCGGFTHSEHLTPHRLEESLGTQIPIQDAYRKETERVMIK